MKVKSPIILLGAILMSTAVWSQKPERKAVRNEIVAGRYLQNNSPIKGVEYLFNTRIHSFGFDSTASNCFVQFRKLKRNGKSLKRFGFIGVFNFDTDSLLWLQRIDYFRRQPFTFQGILLSYRNDFTLHGLNFTTGKKVWKIKGDLWHVHENPPVAFFYDVGYPADEMEPMTVFNMRTGKQLWRRNIPRRGGWLSILYPSDSVLLFSAHGLHQFNVFTGKGWDYNVLTSKKCSRKEEQIARFDPSIITLKGNYIAPKYGFNLVTYSSNIWGDSSHIWYASRQKLSCLSHEGESLWSVPIEADDEGQSFLWTHDSLLYRLNQGYAFYRGALLLNDRPSIESYDLKTGLLKSSRVLGERQDLVRNFLFNHDTLILLFNKRIVRYNYTLDQALDTISFDDSVPGKPSFFLADHIFYRVSDSLYKPVNSLLPGGYAVYFTERKIVLINSELQVTDTIEMDSLLMAESGFGVGSVLLRDKKKLIAIDNEGRPFATIDIGENDFQIFGQWLYYADNKRLVAVCMSSFM